LIPVSHDGTDGKPELTVTSAYNADGTGVKHGCKQADITVTLSHH